MLFTHLKTYFLIKLLYSIIKATKIIRINKCYMGRVKRIWCCSLIQAVSQEEPSDRKPDPRPVWMAGYAQLKFVMTECSKTQIRLMRPI